MHILKFLIKIICFAGVSFVAPVVPATEKISLWPTGLYLGIDTFRFFNNFFEKNIAGCSTSGRYYEYNATFDINRMMIEGDYGWGIMRRTGIENGNKKKKEASLTNGKYFRIGLNYNLLSNTRHKNVVFFGIRYARSFFKFDLKGQRRRAQEATPGPIINRSRKNVFAEWWEIVGGGKVKFFSLFYIGCSLRYKFAKKLYNNKNVLPFDILGWGLGENEDCFGYNLYLTLRIPLYNDMKKLSSLKQQEQQTPATT